VIVQLVLGGALAAVGAELIARGILRRSKRYALVPHARSEFQLDLSELPQLEPLVRTAINAEGERGGELPSRDRRTFRVLVAGGSAAECYMLDQEAAWPAVVERELRADPGPIEQPFIHVGNIARSLLPCAGIARILEGVLPRYPHLDVLVTYVCASDVVAWMQQGAPSQLSESELSEEQLFPVGPAGELGWSPRRSALRRLLVRGYRRLLHPVDRREGVGRAVGRNRRMRAEAPNRIDEVPDARGMLARFEVEFRRLVEISLAHGARVLVARQPWIERDFTAEEELLLWNYGRGRPHAEAVDSYYTHRVAHQLLAEVDAIQSRVARELGVAELDVRSVLPSDFEHYYDDLHSTPLGSAVIGREVAAAIRGMARPQG
jgi:hypothetical protein